MKLKNSQILALVGSQSMRIGAALASLHGATKKVGTSEDGKPIFDQTPYDLGANIRMNLALAMSQLIPCKEAFEKCRNDTLKLYQAKSKESGEEKFDGESAHFEAFDAEIAKLLEVEVDVGKLPTIKKADLKADVNKISATVLLALFPIISDIK